MATSLAEEAKKEAEFVWQKYREAKANQFGILRSGFYICGAADLPKLGESRAESDLEHIAGLLYLIRLMSEAYPKIIPHKYLGDFYTFALFHEIGEIAVGDIPDDGARDEKGKIFLERNAVVKFLKGFSHESKKEILGIYDDFNGKNGIGKTMFFLDKVEAVLMCFIYELNRHPGRRDAKSVELRPISKGDKANMKITGTDLCADNWACNLILRGRKFDFPFLMEFIDILQAAALDIRGEKMSWISQAMEYDFSGLYL